MSYNLAEVEFTREIPEEHKARAAWMINAIKFMRIRGWLSSNWVKCTSGILEGGKIRVPGVLHGSNLEDLHLSDNLKDVYHAANDVKPRFDKFIANLMKKSFPKAKTYVCDSWVDWQAKVDKAAETKSTAVVASAAELDAVDAATVLVPLKDRDRTLRKSKEAYGGSVNYVKDIVRASIVCNSDEDVATLINTLNKCTDKYHPLGGANPYDKQHRDASADGRRPGTADSTDSAGSTTSKGFSVAANIGEGMRIVEVKNRFKLSAFNGYRDILVTIAADYVEDHSDERDPHGKLSRNHLKAVPEHTGAASGGDDGTPKRLGQVICELQIHHLSMLQTSQRLDSYGYYTFFRAFFQPEWEHGEKTLEALAAVTERNQRDFTNKLKALKTMDQVGEFVEALEGAMQVYLGGVGRVGKDLPRLSAYFSLFSRVNEVALAEAMQSSIIRQLRERGHLRELFKELSRLSRYFQGLKRYHHALPLSEEALAICTQLHGEGHIDSAHQLTNHANLLYCCGDLQAAVPLFRRALDIKRAVAGRLHPLTYEALNNLGELYDDTEQYLDAYETYQEVLSIHREIARNSRTGQAGPEVAEALVHLAQIEEIMAWREEDGEDRAHAAAGRNKPPPPPPKVGEEVVDPKVLKEREEMARRRRDERRRNLFKKALRLYEEAMQIYRDFYGPVHERCAGVYDALCNLRDLQGMLGAAIDSARRALQVRLQVHQETCDYTGVDPSDYARAPPHPNLCGSYTRLGELLLDVGDVREAKGVLQTAVALCEVIAHDERNHKLCFGKENALMALASAQTGLADAYLRLGGPKNYQACRPLLQKAYSTRMKYVGVRAHSTAHTMNLQGMLDELEQDWHEELHQVLRDQKQAEEDERRRTAKRRADYELVNKVEQMAGAKTRVGVVGAVKDGQHAPAAPDATGAGAGAGTGTGAGAGAASMGEAEAKGEGAESLWKGPMKRMEAALAFSSNGTSSSGGGGGGGGGARSGRPEANRQKQLEAEAEAGAEPRERTEEELDQQRRALLEASHVHTKSTRDTLARQQLHARVKRAAELLETVEHCRDIGETEEAVKYAAHAVAWLLPVQRKMDTAALPEDSKWRAREPAKAFAGAEGEGQGQGEEEGSVASRSVASRKEAEERDDAAAQLTSFVRAKQGKAFVNVDMGGPDDKLAMAVVLSQLGCTDEDRGYFHSACDYFFQALQLTCLVYYPETHHLYSTLEAIEEAMLRATDTTAEVAAAVSAAIGMEEKERAEHAKARGKEEPPAPQEGAPRLDPHEGHSHYGHPKGEAGTHSFCHDDIALCLANLACSLRLAGQYELSCGYAMCARDMYVTLREGHEAHGDISRMDHLLALNTYALGRYQLAYDYIDRALRNRKASYGTTSHPDYAASMNVKGIVEAALGKAELAEETLAECMKVRGKIYGTSDPSYALGTNSWAASLFMLDDLARGGRVFTESFESRERQLGSGSDAVLTCLHNMAALFVRQNDYTNADPFLKGADQVRAFLEQQYGPVYGDNYQQDLFSRTFPKPKARKRRHGSALREPGTGTGIGTGSGSGTGTGTDTPGSSRPGSRDSLAGSRPGSRGHAGSSRPSSRDSVGAGGRAGDGHRSSAAPRPSTNSSGGGGGAGAAKKKKKKNKK